MSAPPVTSSVEALCAALIERGQITPTQAQTIQTRARVFQQRILRSKGPRYRISAAEVIAAMQLQNASGRPLNEDRIAEAIAQCSDLPYVKLDALELDPKLVTETFSRAFTRHHAVLPISRDGDLLTLAVADPHDAMLLTQLRRTLPSTPLYVVSSKADILRILTEFHGFRKSVAAAADDFAQGSDLGNLEQFVALKNVDDIEANDAHIVNAVEYLLHYAFGHRASDIHIEPKRDHTAVRLRIDGILHHVYQMPKVVHAPFTSRLKMLARMDIAEKRRPQDGRIKTQEGDREVELRVSTLPVAFGEKIVIRILDPQRLMQDLSGLGLDAEELTRYRRFLGHKTGLILVTGPTGSGKTSTLYSSLRQLAGPSINVTTIEDPIEMVHEPFNQVQVNQRIDLSFPEALRTILRQDPDVIMVGEIRDEETAQMAIQAALTGHLVLSTLHTNDAPSSIARLIDLGLKPFLIASTLIGVVAQRLLRRICPECNRETFLTPEQISTLDIKLPPNAARQLPVRKGTGCASCRHTGMLGRIAVFEMMEINDTLRRLIQNEADANEIVKAARADGMLTLREVAIRKMARGEVPFDEVISVLGV